MDGVVGGDVLSQLPAAPGQRRVGEEFDAQGQEIAVRECRGVWCDVASEGGASAGHDGIAVAVSSGLGPGRSGWPALTRLRYHARSEGGSEASP